MRLSAHCEFCEATHSDCTCELRCATCGLGFGNSGDCGETMFDSGEPCAEYRPETAEDGTGGN